MEEIISPFKIKAMKKIGIKENLLCYRLLKVCITFVLVDFSWIFFRANRLKDAMQIIKQMITIKNQWILFDGSLYKCGLSLSEFWLMIFAIMVLMFSDFCKHKEVVIRKIIMNQEGWFRYIFIAISIMIVMVFGKYGPTYNSANFIYFQF